MRSRQFSPTSFVQIAKSANGAIRKIGAIVLAMESAYVGGRLRQLREERKLNQAELAKALQISPSYLNQLEHNSRPLTVPVLLRISEVFGVDASFFAPQDTTRLVAELSEVLLDDDLDATGQQPGARRLRHRPAAVWPRPSSRCTAATGTPSNSSASSAATASRR